MTKPNLRVKMDSIHYLMCFPEIMAFNIHVVSSASGKPLKWKYVNTAMVWRLMCHYMWVMLGVIHGCQKMNNDNAICLGNTCIHLCYLIRVCLTRVGPPGFLNVGPISSGHYSGADAWRKHKQNGKHSSQACRKWNMACTLQHTGSVYWISNKTSDLNQVFNPSLVFLHPSLSHLPRLCSFPHSIPLSLFVCLCLSFFCRWCLTTWDGNASATGRRGAASWRPAGRSPQSSGWWAQSSKSASTLLHLSKLTTGTPDSSTTPTTTTTTTITIITTTIITIIRTTTTTTTIIITRIGGGRASTSWSTLKSRRISASGTWGRTQPAHRAGSATRPAPAWTTVRVCAAGEATTSCSRRGANVATASFTGAAMWSVKSAG